MPRSWQARITRNAISPRLATRMRWNMSLVLCPLSLVPCSFARDKGQGTRDGSPGGIDLEQGLTVLNRLLILDQHLGDDAATLGLNLVEDLHRLDHAHDRLRRHPAA